ncbi:MAG TPA: thiamine phosphate synthase [Pirellulales bacterium]
MAWSFTPGSERVLAAAAAWRSCDDRDELRAPELLLGLLAEAECRAAAMLQARGIDADAVLRKWPSLRPTARAATKSRDVSPDVDAAFHEAVNRLWDYPPPLVLATEFILLGLVASPGEISSWLREQGFDPDQLEQQIHGLYGHEKGPLPVVVEEEEIAAESRAPNEVAAPSAAPGSAGASPSRNVELPNLAVGPSVPLPEVPLARLLDAAANRAREGLRVVEDFARMVLDDAHLTRELKHLRHDLQTALEPLSRQALLASRDTAGDVGTRITTPGEMDRPDIGSVVAANWNRLGEALRSLEEYSKVCLPPVAAAIERVRYRAYTLEKAIEIAGASRDRMAGVSLCVLIDGRASEAEFVRLVEALVAAGVPMLQLRDKRLDDRELLARAQILRDRTSQSSLANSIASRPRTLCVINDRPDIAALVGADGVHVGQEDLPARAARRIVGPGALVGVSTHSIEQARAAVLDGANCIGVGPTFASTTKHFAEHTGVELLRQVAAEITLPALAIGGINLENVSAVKEAGFSRVAVSAAVSGAVDPSAAAHALLQKLRAPITTS